MRAIVEKIFWFVVRFILRLRYRVRVDGLEQLRALKGPVLVLPNHPGYIDPPTVLSHLYRAIQVPLRPLVYSGTYRVPFLLPLMKLIRAFEVPDLSAQSQSAAAQAQQLIDTVVEGIDEGNILLNHVADARADLLVMGAYGHHRFRELILGGVTQEIFEHMTTPVLMSH